MTESAADAAPPKPELAAKTAEGTDGGIDLAPLADLAALHTSVADAAALLDVDEAALRARVEARDTECSRVWRRGQAAARVSVRRAQFEHLEKNATIAIHLGKELLGQDGGEAGPVSYNVDTGICRRCNGCILRHGGAENADDA